MRYAHYDENKKLVSIGEGPILPGEMVQLSNEDYDKLIAQYQTAVTPDPIAAAKQRIDDAYQGEIEAATVGYPQWEIDSWLRQESEARSILTARPWIEAAAGARGIDAGDLVDKIKAKADAFTLLHATATGKRQRLQNEIDLLQNPTQQQLDAIEW